MPYKPPLLFQVPNQRQSTKTESNSIPPGQQLVLKFATPYLISWGVKKENYVLQQIYQWANITLALVTIHLSEYSLFEVTCEQAFKAFQYTIQGYGFAALYDHGCIPLYEGTYTLQYIPKGTHKVILSAGTYHYFYMISDTFLSSPTSTDQHIEGPNQYTEKGKNNSIVTRLPMDHRVKDLIRRLLELPGDEPEVPFTTIAIITKLNRHYYRQINNMVGEPKPGDFRAWVNTFLANNMDISVRQLIQKIKQDFSMEATTLRNYWIKSGKKKDSPRASFKKLRFEYALYLIAVENLSSKQAQEQLGFKNHSNFVEEFNNYFGYPPNQIDKFLIR